MQILYIKEYFWNENEQILEKREVKDIHSFQNLNHPFVKTAQRLLQSTKVM